MSEIIKMDFDIIKFNIKQGRYRYIGSGSGRRVFDLDNGYVVKVAKNRKGIAQNETEYQISLKDDSNLFAKVIQVSDDYKLLIMEKAEKLKSFQDIWEYFNVKNNRELFGLAELKYIYSNYNLVLGDLYKGHSWGMVHGRPVIIDYGFTWKVKRKYYSRF